MAGLFDKAMEFADTDEGEKVTDALLERADGFADKATGGTHDQQIDQVEKLADEHIGRE